MKRGRFIAATAAAAAGGIVVPARAQIPQQPGFPNQQFLPQLTIAVNVTLSGDLEKYGREVVKGVQAAVDEQNRFTPSVSHVWGYRALDDRNDAGLAASNANVAAADSTVIGIVGNLTGPMTVAALSRYANTGFAVITPTVTADAVTKRGYHNVYRLPAKDSTVGTALCRRRAGGTQGRLRAGRRVRRRLRLRRRQRLRAAGAQRPPSIRRPALSAERDRPGGGRAHDSRPQPRLCFSQR